MVIASVDIARHSRRTVDASVTVGELMTVLVVASEHVGHPVTPHPTVSSLVRAHGQTALFADSDRFLGHRPIGISAGAGHASLRFTWKLAHSGLAVVLHGRSNARPSRVHRQPQGMWST